MSGFNLNWHGDAIGAEMEAEVKHRLLNCGQDLKQKSSDDAPVDTGDLRGSIAVDDSNIDAFEVKVGSNLPYALRQHEDLTLNHPMGGKSKYLEDNLNENAQKYEDYIAEGVGKVTT